VLAFIPILNERVALAILISRINSFECLFANCCCSFANAWTDDAWEKGTKKSPQKRHNCREKVAGLKIRNCILKLKQEEDKRKSFPLVSAMG